MEEKVLVIDVGGTFIKYGLIDEQCHLTQTSKIKTPYQSQEHFLETLQNIYLSYQNVHIQGIAMSVPGKIDVMQGVMLTSGALVYLEGLKLAKKLSALCDHVPVSVENDGKAAALCESWVGQAKDCQSCVVLIFGSGIGGGIVIEHHVLRGLDLIAGEFSPVFIDLHKGHYQNFAETYSTLSIVKKVQHMKQNEHIDGEYMMQLYRQQDQDIVSILDDWFEAIAKFCYNIDCMINPECICIGGGISQDVLFVEKIKEKIDEVFGKAYLFRKPQVKSCQYHNDSNLIGAYYTYRQLFSKDGEKNENNFKGR